MQRSRWKFYGGLLVVFLGACVLYLAALAQGPDYDVSFVRDVPSELDAAVLGRSIGNTAAWPAWFYSLREAKVVSGGALAPGSLVKLEIDPRKGPWSHFTVELKVLKYAPDREIELEVVSDSTGKLTRLFSRLDWKIELLPRADGAKGTLIRGIATAHTATWRSRLFGKLADRILMNQVFYPNLIALSGLTQPSAQSPWLPSQT